MKGENPMRRLLVQKVVVNMGVGESGERLAKAEALLERLTGQRPVRTYSRSTIKPWGIRRGAPIGCKVTLHKQRMEEFLKKALDAVDNKLRARSFDDHGNFSFGIREHIDIAGMKYDPDVGIFGMDVCVSVERPGYRVKRRRLRRSRIARRHQVTREEAMAFMRERYGVEIAEEEEHGS